MRLDQAQLYDRYAEDCVRSAEKIEDPGHRTMLLKAAAEWKEAAKKLRQVQQPVQPQEQPSSQRLQARRPAPRMRGQRGRLPLDEAFKGRSDNRADRL